MKETNNGSLYNHIMNVIHHDYSKSSGFDHNANSRRSAKYFDCANRKNTEFTEYQIRWLDYFDYEHIKIPIMQKVAKSYYNLAYDLVILMGNDNPSKREAIGSLFRSKQRALYSVGCQLLGMDIDFAICHVPSSTLIRMDE